MAGDHYDNAGDKKVYCPFYKGTVGGQKIVCEGPVKNTNVWLTFAGKLKMKAYMEEYCYQKDCWRCRVYDCADAKYGEEE